MITEIVRKKIVFIFSLLVLSACFCFAKNIATRDLPDCYVSGTTFNVVVYVVTDPVNFPSTGIVVTETLPLAGQLLVLIHHGVSILHPQIPISGLPSVNFPLIPLSLDILLMFLLAQVDNMFFLGF